MASTGIHEITISSSTVTLSSVGSNKLDDFNIGSLIRIIGSTVNAGTYRIKTISKSGTTPSFTTVEELTDESAADRAIVDYVLYNTESVNDISQISGPNAGMNYHVFLDFGARGKDELGQQSPLCNRIGLLAESFNVQTTKQRPTFPIPGSAIITGESKTLSIDMAASTKTFQINGIITEQYITKKYTTGGRMDETNPLAANEEYPGKDGSEVTRLFTPQEVAQLLHSALDSSFLQSYQNLTNMAVLVPSRVGYDYNYHSGVTEGTPIEHLPLIPFSFKSRHQDSIRSVTADNTEYFTPNHSSSVAGHPVVIQNINTDFVPGQPWMTFSMGGEFIFDVLGTSIDVYEEVTG